MGGDEFSVIFENGLGQEDVEIIARKIQTVFSQPFPLANQILDITASIGISLFPFDGEEAESLLKYADIAMYIAKRARNQVCFYRDFKDDL